LLDCQIARLPDCQIARLPDCQIASGPSMVVSIYGIFIIMMRLKCDQQIKGAAVYYELLLFNIFYVNDVLRNR